MKILLTILFSVSLLSGCSTTVNKQQINQVKSVAVVGFSVIQDSGNPIQHVHNVTESDDFTAHLATDFYRSFTQTFAKSMNVKTLSMEQVINNSYYQQLHEKYAGVKKLSFVIGKTYRAEGMLSGQGFFQLSPTERTELAKALGVDSVIGLESMLYKGESMGFSVIKVGSSDIKFRVTVTDYEQYDNHSVEPIVDISNFVGETPSDSYESLTVNVGNDAWDLSKPDRKALVAAVSTVAEGLAKEIKTAD